MWRALRIALIASLGLLAACGSSPAPSFHPGGGTATATKSPSASPTAQAQSLISPAFGSNAHLDMTGWLPASASERPAVITDKNFLQAFLYAEYTGGRDQTWKAYVSSSSLLASLTQDLAGADVTTESWTGTIRFFSMSAVANAPEQGDLEVSECIDAAGARNTSLSTGKVLPASQQNTTDQNYYYNSDVLAKDSAGQWLVTAIPQPVYYPQAAQCKP